MKHDFTVYLSVGISILLLSTTRCSEPKKPKVAVLVSVKSSEPNRFDSILNSAICKTALHASLFDSKLARAKFSALKPEATKPQWPTDHPIGKEYNNFIKTNQK